MSDTPKEMSAAELTEAGWRAADERKAELERENKVISGRLERELDRAISILEERNAAQARIAELEREREHTEFLITNKQNAVNAYFDRVQRLEGIIARERMCSTCCGTPHASGLPCVCGGTNSREEEVKGLRLAAMKAEDALADCEDRLEGYRKALHEQTDRLMEKR